METDNPNWVSAEQLQQMNEKMGWMIEKMDLMLSELRQINQKTVPPQQSMGSSYQRS